jgi:nitroreductase
MPAKNQAALDFLLTRRSTPAKTLEPPVPGRAELETILTAAARSPDHGKLEPWRFVVLEAGAMARLAALAEARAEALGMAPEKAAKGVRQLADSPLAVVVVSAPVEAEKVPAREQLLSAGAVCLSLLNAALASGWGANWLTGWMVDDRTFLEQGFGLAPGESVAGIVHIGTPRVAPSERPRPDIAAKTSWISA